MQTLLKAGADVNTVDFRGQTPLHIACEQGNTDIVFLLLEKGADIGATDCSGRQPSHAACSNGNLLTVLILLDHGADLNARDKDGNTLLDLVVGFDPENDEYGDNEDIAEMDREAIIDRYREFHPELVMEKFCTVEPRL